MKHKISLIALDMDGTLFNNQGEISRKDRETLKKATEAGIAVAIATGRAFVELPAELLASVGIRYAITGNGSGLYRVEDGACIFSDCMENELLFPILDELKKLPIYYDVYVEGKAYCPQGAKAMFRDMDLPESLMDHLERMRIEVDDVEKFLETSGKKAEKSTLNFIYLGEGKCLARDEAEAILKKYPQVEYLCGGFHNWEFTRRGVTKGSGLRLLAEKLGVPMEETMACGDSGNDLPMIVDAALGVAMANASEEIKEAAEFITLSNEESGVAYAVEKFALSTPSTSVCG